MVMVLWCNTSFAKEFITFKNCYSTDEGQKSIEDDERFDEHTYDIDKTKKTVVRTIVWTDQMVEKYKSTNISKIEQSEHKIKAIGKRYISTDFPNKMLGMEFVFDLKNYTVQTRLRVTDKIDQYTMVCE